MSHATEQAHRLALWMTMRSLAELWAGHVTSSENSEKAYWERKESIASRLATELEVEIEVAEAKGETA
jgi:hypothetical protein